MMQNKILTVLLVLGLNVYGQKEALPTDELGKSIQTLQTDIAKLSKENQTMKSEINTLSIKISNSKIIIDSLETLIQNNSSAIYQTANHLGLKIDNTEQTTNNRIDAVGRTLSTNSLYGIIGVLSAILISGLLFWFLNKRQKTDKTAVVEQLQQTKSSIEESLIKEFGKQTNLIESELQLLAQQRIENAKVDNVEPDHSLALRVASEINLIERNLNLMDKGTKGLKQLERSVGKLKDNLSANGYEMPELLGKVFNQGMRVIVATSIPDENLEKGQEIITKILIPQVNYNDKMIQAAQIEVSVGY